MNENLIEKLCANPRRWVIVAGGVVLIALLSILPQVDVYLAARSERADLNEKLLHAVEVAEQLPGYEKATEEKKGELALLHQREVARDQVTELRSWLVASARTAGCQVRRIDFDTPIRSHWNAKEDPLNVNQDKQQGVGRGPFDLERIPVNLTVTGSSNEVRILLEALDKDSRLKHPKVIDLRPSDRGTQKIQLELTLWYFALVDAEAMG